MKEVEFIINPEKLEILKRILDVEGGTGVIIDSVLGYGHQKGHRQHYTRDDNPGINMLPKMSVRTVVPDERVDFLIDHVTDELSSGGFGDGKIFVRNIEQAVRIRTKEKGNEAL